MDTTGITMLLVLIIIAFCYFSFKGATDGQDFRNNKDTFSNYGKGNPPIPPTGFGTAEEDYIPTFSEEIVDPGVQLNSFMLNKKGYLFSSQWDSKRKSRLSIDNYTCQSCGATGIPLAIHHERGYNLIPNEPLESLKSLCRECHKEEHKLHGFPKGYQGYMDWNHPISVRK